MSCGGATQVNVTTLYFFLLKKRKKERKKERSQCSFL